MTQPKMLGTNRSIANELRKHVATAIDVFRAVMEDKDARTSDRLTAASKIVETYIKFDKRVDEVIIMEQQKRMNALRINKVVDEASGSNSGYKSLNVLDIEFEDAAYS
jgi:hypothetical protein